MNRSVRWVTLDSAVPMGQQHHESDLQRALAATGDGRWTFSATRVRNLRGPAGSATRLPLRPLQAAPYPAAALAGTLAYGSADLVHRFDLRLPPRLGPEVVTVHDLPPLRFDDEGSLPSWAAAGARRAAAVICPSRFAADEVRALLGVRDVRVVRNGVDSGFRRRNPMSAEELRSLGIEKRFVLHVGGATKRKNLPALAAAWSSVAGHVDATLVLAGPAHPVRDRLLADTPATRYVGYLDPPTVARLMQAAAAVVVPSLYEGFGLPALEGMAAGVAVVASRRGALPEVCGDAALLVPPTAPGLADGLLAVLTDAGLAAELQARGLERAQAFTWERAAAETLAVYEKALS